MKRIHHHKLTLRANQRQEDYPHHRALLAFLYEQHSGHLDYP